MDEDDSHFSHTREADDRVLEMLPVTFWDDFLQCYPETERLDISEIDTRLMDCIVAAAARWLPKVRELILPRSHHTVTPASDWVLQLQGPIDPQTHQTDGTETLRVVVEALGRWHATNGGLRVLTIPDWIVEQEEIYADFVAAVAQFCPQIEYFVSRVPKRIRPLSHQVTSLRLAVWVDFCLKRPLLREFSWNFAPCTKEYMDIFQTSRKPQLETLHMVLNFLDQRPVMTDLSSIQWKVAQLPTLRSFEFDLGTTPRDVGFSMSSLNKLVLQLATSGPKLETFKNHRSVGDRNMTITGTAIQALAKNTMLHKLDINSLQISDGDDVLVEMLKPMLGRSTTVGDRFVDIRAVDPINAAVLRMLECLVQPTSSTHPSLAQSKAKLQFRVRGMAFHGTNSHLAPPQEKDTLPSRQELEKLVEAIIFRYGDTLTYLRVLVRTQYIGSSRSFDTIEKIAMLFNVDKQTSPFFGGLNPSQDQRTDVDDRGGVFYV